MQPPRKGCGVTPSSIDSRGETVVPERGRHLILDGRPWGSPPEVASRGRNLSLKQASARARASDNDDGGGEIVRVQSPALDRESARKSGDTPTLFEGGPRELLGGRKLGIARQSNNQAGPSRSPPRRHKCSRLSRERWAQPGGGVEAQELDKASGWHRAAPHRAAHTPTAPASACRNRRQCTATAVGGETRERRKQDLEGG
jgi:hypothetical protein